MCGVILLILLVTLILVKASPAFAPLILVGLYLSYCRAERKRQAVYWRDRRLREAGLARRIAMRQRAIALTDKDLGLASAYLSAVNADVLEWLANLRRS